MKRMKYLVHIADQDPKRFEAEWERRMSSWLEMIRREAWRWRAGDGEATPSIFAIVDEALAVLESCGKSVYDRYAKEAHSQLTHECCRQFGVHSGLRHVRTSPRLFL
jgi:hypothetical protein